jgi:hypothetical protein
MPNSESRENVLLAGGLIALFGFVIPWFTVPNEFGGDNRIYGQDDLSLGWRWVIVGALILVSILALWARLPDASVAIAGFSIFVALLTLVGVMLAAGRAATKAEFLVDVEFWGVIPLLIGNALVITGAMRGVGGSVHRRELDYLHQSADLARAEIREMKNTSRTSSSSVR